MSEEAYTAYADWKVWRIEDGGEVFWYASQFASDALSEHENNPSDSLICAEEEISICIVAPDKKLSMTYETDSDIAGFPAGWCRDIEEERALGGGEDEVWNGSEWVPRNSPRIAAPRPPKIIATAAEWARYYESHGRPTQIFSTLF